MVGLGFGAVFGHDFDIFVTSSSNAGATWATRVLEHKALTDLPSDQDYTPRTATDGDGNWTIVWSGRDGAAGFDIRYADLTTPRPAAASEWALYE